MQNPGLTDFFLSGFYEEYWPDADNENSTIQKAQSLLELVGAKSGHILDWRGGSGRYSYWFAKKGFEVTLLDFIPDYIRRADELFKLDDLKIRTIVTDSRNTPVDIQADYSFCIGNSVGFMELEDEIKAFKSLFNALRPGARLYVDCVNLLYIASHFQAEYEEQRDINGSIRRGKSWFDFHSNVLHKEFEIEKKNGEKVIKPFNQTLYTPHDLSNLVEKSGFIVDEIFSDLHKMKMSFESSKIHLIAHKPI